MNKIKRISIFALAMFICTFASAAGSKKLSKINSTQLYPLYFPGYLSSIKATGKVDFKDWVDVDLVYGLDYVVLKYDYPRFSYVELEEGEDLQCGCYLVQFVDNLNNTDVSMRFSGSKDTTWVEPSIETPYVLAGNTGVLRDSVQGYFLRYSPESLRFELKKDDVVNGLEAYIATNASYPVTQIAVSPVPTALKRVYAEDGATLSVKPTNGGAVFHSATDTSLPIYNTAGQLIKIAYLDKGANHIDLPQGLYVASGVKFSVR